MERLNLNERGYRGKNSSRKCRKEGKVPGLVYGKELGNFLFEVGELELNREVCETGEHGILNFNINNEEKMGVIKEIQRDPVTHKIIHIDLSEVKSSGVVETEVPIQYVGEESVGKEGGILQKEKDSVKVRCTVDSLPKNVKVDVSHGIPGSVFKYADLEIGEEISIIDDIDSIIASVTNEQKKVEETVEVLEVSEKKEEK